MFDIASVHLCHLLVTAVTKACCTQIFYWKQVPVCDEKCPRLSTIWLV